MKTFFPISLLALAISSFSQTRSIIFEDTSKTFAQLKEKAKKENKLIFMDCYTVWCGPCKWMAKNIFTNDTVADFYNKRFINAKFDMEKGEGKVLREKYNVNVFPTLLFLDGDSVLHRSTGAGNTKKFIQLGEDALVPETRVFSMLDAFNKGKHDRQFVSKLLDALGSAHLPDEKEKVLSAYLEGKTEQQLLDTAEWRILQKADKFDSKGFRFILKNAQKLSAFKGDTIINEIISRVLSEKVQEIFYQSGAENKEQAIAKLKDTLKQTNPSINEIFFKRIDLAFFKYSRHWYKFSEIAFSSGVIETLFWKDAWRLDMVAWDFYLYVDDKAKLQKAIQWSKRSIAINNNYPKYKNTLSHLLYKTGQTQEAIRMQEDAIQSAKKQKEESYPPVKELEDALEKFKNEKK